jgi:hypothetical protein
LTEFAGFSERVSIPFNSTRISYEEWTRTSQSWKDLLPRRNYDQLDDTDETVEAYVSRHAKRFKIPYWVADQFLYGLYDNRNVVNNYGWIDFDRFRFREVQISLETLLELYVIRQYQPYVEVRRGAVPYKDFCCISKDRLHWQEHRTWRVPPILLNVSALKEIPDQAEIHGTYQLVEGHSRFGYLLAHVAHDVPVETYHTVFMLDSA